MKKIVALAMTAAVLSACTKSELSTGPTSKEKLNILTTISSKAIVDGTTLPKGSVIGVHVTQGAGGTLAAYAGQAYEPGGDNLQDGQNVRFDNAADASKWMSQSADAKAQNLMIGGETGTIYAYYPYTATVTGLGVAATIPVTIQQSGDIDLPVTPIAGTAYLNGDETDYLYYKPAAARATVSSKSTATATLSMAHTMARISFRVYVSGDAPLLTVQDNGSVDYILTGYVIKNKDSRTLLCAKNIDATMKIADGVVATTTNTQGGQIERVIKLNGTEGYPLTRVAAGDADETEKGKMIWFSNLTLPIATIASSTVNGKTVSNDLEIVFQMKKGSSGSEENYVVPLPVIAGQSDKWEAGNNYQYTVKVNSAMALSIEQVTVAQWNDVVGGDTTIE